MKKGIYLFTNDLRLRDNAALTAAAKECDQLSLVYILDTDNQPIGEAQYWWLEKALQDIQKQLKSKNYNLVLGKGKTGTWLKKHCADHNISTIYIAKSFLPTKLEKKIHDALANQDIETKQYPGYLLTNPSDIQNKSGTYFKVFTPYWRTAQTHIIDKQPLAIPKLPRELKIQGLTLTDLKLTPEWPHQFDHYWTATESQAHQQLNQFIESNIDDYQKGRDFPDKKGTSRLSPYIHFGQVSPRQIYHVARQHSQTKGNQIFLSELGWREFSYYLLQNFPIHTKNFRAQFDQFKWQRSKRLLTAWQKGQTGYPIVDAGMRELYATGYMHNRVRMIVGSFLTKHCLIHWQEGAKWFTDHLFDADLASNSAGWQWVSGSGADASPYFRIFNPILQGNKFDPEGRYTHQWVPELTDIEIRWLQQPWLSPALPEKFNYPKPVVDHKTARERALKAYKHLKK